MAQVSLAFFDAKPYDMRFFEAENQQFHYTIKYFENRLTEDTAGLAKRHNVVCGFVNDDFNPAVIDQLIDGGAQLIALRSAGYNNVNLQAAFKRIHVVRVPAYSPHAVAEHAVALMLTLNRKTHRAYSRTRELNFSIKGLLGFDMYGKTAGIVGMGKIGKAIAPILSGFGMRVLAYDLRADEAFASRHGIEYTDLDTIYRYSDIITLHAPLTPQTHHLINNHSIKKMKDGVMIINTGRGGLIDTRALIRGLKSRKIGAAGLDVYEEESDYFFEDYSSEVVSDDVLARLLTFPNVLITSHQGFFTEEALTSIARTTLENIRAFYEGAPLDNEICYKCEQQPCAKKETGRCF